MSSASVVTCLRVAAVPAATSRRWPSGGFRAVVYSGADPLTNKPRYIDDIAAKLNGRPRETLGFKTPSEAPNEALR
jgi:hypothetical protein